MLTQGHLRHATTQSRAYSEEAKQQRRESMLAAAAALFERKRYDEVSMAGIAEEAGVAKGTLYVYFRTKEELFLGYAEQELRSFFAGLRRQLERQTRVGGPEALLDALRTALAERPAMVRLLALLHGVLESNTEFERALSFRRSLLPLLYGTGAEVERHLGFLPEGGGARLLLTIHAMALGFQQLADPSEVIRRVEQQPGMELFALDFEQALLGSVDLMLAGMQARAPRRK